EVTVTADSHLQAGIEPDGLAEALARGRAESLAAHGVELAFTYDINGMDGHAGAERTIAWAERFVPPGSTGFGIGGPEDGLPRREYAPYFRRAMDIGLASVPHAGETTGPCSIRESIDALGAVRIGHGIAAAQDASLMAELVERGIVLEVCPTSNVCTRVVATLAEHPFPVLRDAGVRVTLNTDDPGMFDTDLDREFAIAHAVFGIDAQGLAGLAREAVLASLGSIGTKARILAEIDRYLVAALPA
ncbi:MAG: adenosine deaminase family protein, partial [Candidatus Nanopelagicales bacterium]